MSVKLTIDEREVEVEPRTTILDAARKLGIRIPTLCHQEGVKPVGSCFLCVVQVEGRANLIPSCTAPASEGMVVTTDSEDIRAARKMALELLLSDHIGDCMAPCIPGCPANMDIAAMNRYIEAGDFRGAIAVVKERIPFPAALGRICPRYCERVCRRKDLDEAIAICALKRFVADVDLAAEEVYLPPCKERTGKRVAIVGAGPTGLSAAYYLLQEGHICTVFDTHPEPGGMFRYGVPEYRLPRLVLAGEIEVIRKLGAEFHMSTCLGRDFSLEYLRRDYDAVFLAIGARLEDEVELEGGKLALSAVDFLGRAAEGDLPDVGNPVVIIGGDNEALTAARTALRTGAEVVTIVWQKTRRAMSALSDLVQAAEAEGVKFELEAKALNLERTGDGRFELSLKRGEETFSLEACSVILASGRSVDKSLAEEQGLAVAHRGIKVDRNTLATSLEGVFAGGDAVSGPSVGVRAVASGRLAAVSINQYLSGQEVVGETKLLNVRLGRLDDAQRRVLFRNTEQHPRVLQPSIGMEKGRNSFNEIEQGFPVRDAKAEASRCLQCDCLARDDCKLRLYGSEYGAQVNRFKGERRPLERDDSHPQIVYEAGKCILCGLCVRITDQEGEKLGMSFSQRGFVTRVRVPLAARLAEGLTSQGRRCVEACPTGALACKRGQGDGKPG